MNNQGESEDDIHDVGTIGGTISSYSVSSKSKNALSINFKNSLYKKAAKDEENVSNLEGLSGGLSQLAPSQIAFTKNNTRAKHDEGISDLVGSLN